METETQRKKENQTKTEGDRDEDIQRNRSRLRDSRDRDSLGRRRLREEGPVRATVRSRDRSRPEVQRQTCSKVPSPVVEQNLSLKLICRGRR